MLRVTISRKDGGEGDVGHGHGHLILEAHEPVVSDTSERPLQRLARGVRALKDTSNRALTHIIERSSLEGAADEPDLEGEREEELPSKREKRD